MATEKPDRFDEVNWDEFAGSDRFNLSTNTIGMLATGIPWMALGYYNFEYVADGESTFGFVGNETTLSNLDFIFGFTILLFFFYLVLPLYQNPRMTKYYWKEFRRNRPAVVSLVWLGIVFVGGVLGPLFIDPPSGDVFAGYQPPVYMSIDSVYPVQCAGEVRGGKCFGSWQYPLGTTRSGRGVFKTIVYGMTISMKIAFITTTIVAAIGVTFGTVSAYAGGWVDEIMMRIVDIVQSFPTLLFFILILYIYGASLAMFILVFALFAWGGTSRYVRSKALSVSEEEFVQATRISGASPYRVIRRHIVPNTASSIITQLTLLIPGFILAEAQLAFLGLGDSQIPSWGQLIASGRSDLSFAPWIVLAPGFVLFLTILAFNFAGDALLDAINPETEAEADK